ncbi:PDZ domain-containing protein, partial [Staphylococcus hominis]
NVGDLDDSERNAINLPAKVNHGVLIGEVKENGLGDKAGLKKGDVIVELDGKKIEDNLRYRQVIYSHYDDQKTITAKIYRNGAEKNIKIKLK